MGRIFLSDLAASISEKHQIDKKSARRFINSMVELIQDGLAADRIVKIKGLGTFKVIDVEARESVNVSTGERHTIESHSRLTFLPDNMMKELVNRPFSVFETVVLNDGVTFDDDNTKAAVEPEESIIPGETGESSDEVVFIPDEVEIEETDTENDNEEQISSLDTAPSEEDAFQVEFYEEPDQEELSTDSAVDVTDNSTTETTCLYEQPEDSSSDISEEKPDVLLIDETIDDSGTDNLSEEGTDICDVETEACKLVEGGGEYTPEDSEDTPEDTEEEEYGEDADESRSKWKWWAVAAILIGCIGIGAWYFLRDESEKDSLSPAKKQQSSTTMTAKTQTDQETAIVAADTSSTTVIAEEDIPIWQKYNDKDIRTREGAYYITGLDSVLKVRKGDTVKKIAKHFFGSAEMSCYIEVFNDIKATDALEPGTEINIPKIEKKSIVKKRLSNSN